jgi:hypothetical protein
MTWEAALQYSWLAALYTTILLTVLLDSHAILARVVRRRPSVRRSYFGVICHPTIWKGRLLTSKVLNK